MATQKLEVIPTLTEAVKLGLANIVPLILTVILYVLTVWIPWLNVGTTIGLYKVIIAMSEGRSIDPTSIFAKENFTDLGNFFLLLGFLSIGITAATCFMLVPGIIMSIAWGFATLLLIDKKLRPVKAMALSDKATFGNKWNIFLVLLLLSVVLSIVSGIFALIPKVGFIFVFLVSILGAAVAVAVDAVIYRFISAKVDGILAGDDAPAAPAAAVEPEAPVAPAE